MLYVLRNATDQIEAAIDYYLVDDLGRVTLDGSGRWVWVQQLEVSAGANGRRCIRAFIQAIARAIPHAQGAYWIRQDKGHRVVQFSRTQLVKGEEVRV